MGKKWRGKSATRGRGVRRLMASVMKTFQFFWITSLSIVWTWHWAPGHSSIVPQFVYPCDSFRWFCASTTYCVTWHIAQGHLSITHSGTALYPCDKSLCRWSRKMSSSLHAFCVHGTRAFEARLGGPPPKSATTNRKRPFLCCSTLFISLPCTRNISESTFALKSSQIPQTPQPIGKSHVWFIEPCLPFCDAREKFIGEPAWVNPS